MYRRIGGLLANEDLPCIWRVHRGAPISADQWAKNAMIARERLQV